MGLDIGFHKQTDWAPRPGREFGQALTGYLEGEYDYLSLTTIQECYIAFAEKPENAAHVARATTFVAWCEKYWEDGQFEPGTYISVVFDS